MARSEIEVRRTETVFDELDRLHQTISKRAYDLFRHGGSVGDALADWLSAERELVAKPAIELRQKDGRFEVLVALPGIDARQLDVQMTRDEVLIKAETKHEDKADKGTVHMSEFSSGQVFRSMRFPEPIDPASAKAEYKDGTLLLTVAIAKGELATKVDVKAA